MPGIFISMGRTDGEHFLEKVSVRSKICQSASTVGGTLAPLIRQMETVTFGCVVHVFTEQKCVNVMTIYFIL